MVSPPEPPPPRVASLLAVIEVMAAVADERAIGPLLEHVGEPPWWDATPREAIFAVAARLPTAAAPLLVAACEEASLGRARTALEALARIRHPEARALVLRHAPRLGLSEAEAQDLLRAGT